MAELEMAPEVTIWTDAARTPLVREVLDRMGPKVAPIGVGGERAGSVEALAGDLGCEWTDDLRKLLVDRPAAFVLLASPRGVNWALVAEALAAASTVLALEPPEAHLGSAGRRASRSRGDTTVGTVCLVPAFDQSRGWLDAADPLEVLGRVRLVRFSSFGTDATGSLYARLYEAWRVALRFGGGLPLKVCATLSGRFAELPEDLRAMCGHLAVHARMAHGMQGGALLMELSDQVGPVRRELRVVGDHGQVSVRDDVYGLYGPDGGLMDGREPVGAGPGAADLIAAQWRRMLDRGVAASMGAERGPDPPELVACCLACLLSARTGEPESPEKLLKAHGQV